MAFFFKTGFFDKKADGTGTQAVTGVGFTPKAIIFFSAGNTSLEAWQTVHNEFQGFAESFNSGNFAMASSVEHATGGQSNCSGYRSITKAMLFCDPDGALLAEAAVTVFGADGFTVNWTTNNASAYKIGYIALGGDEITDAQGISHIIPAAVGDAAVTGSGFIPTLLFNIGTHQSDTAETGATGHGGISFSWADGVGEACTHVFHRDARNGHEHKLRWSATTFIHVGDAPVFQFLSAAWKSFDADGFTLDVTEKGSVVNGLRSYTLCLKTSTTPWTIGTWDDPATATTETITGVGFDPHSAIFMASGGTLGSGSMTNGGNRSFGAVDRGGVTAAIRCHPHYSSDNLVQVYSSAVSVHTRDVTVTTISETTTHATRWNSWETDGFEMEVTTSDTVEDDVMYITFDDDDPTPAVPITPGDGNQLDIFQMEAMPPAPVAPMPVPDGSVMPVQATDVILEVPVVSSLPVSITFIEVVQYQRASRPVGDPEDFGEGISLDKWQVPFSEPVRAHETLDAAHLTQFILNEEPIPDIPDSVAEMVLYSEAPDFLFRVPEHTVIPEFLTFVNVELDVFVGPDALIPMFAPTLEPPTFHASLIDDNKIDEVTLALEPDVEVDSWFRLMSHEFRNLTWPPYLVETWVTNVEALGDVEETLLTKWYQPFSLPVPGPDLYQVLQPEAAKDQALEDRVDQVELSYWHRPFDQPIFVPHQLDAELHQPSYDFPQELFATVVLDCPPPIRRSPVSSVGTPRRPDEALGLRQRIDETVDSHRRRSPDCPDRK